jgi:hypothetical protein
MAKTDKKIIRCRVCGKPLTSMIDPHHICLPQVKWRTGSKTKKIKPWQLIPEVEI